MMRLRKPPNVDPRQRPALSGSGAASLMIDGMSGVPFRLFVVTIGARDVSALRRFYRALGWSEVPGSDDQ